MRRKKATPKDAAQTPGEAGATPPSDAPCIMGLREVTPASPFLKGLNFDFEFFHSEGRLSIAGVLLQWVPGEERKNYALHFSRWKVLHPEKSQSPFAPGK